MERNKPKNENIFNFQVQFVAIFTHQFQLLFRECDYPKGFMVWIGLHGVMFLFLFSDFYKSKYTSLKNKTKKIVQNGSNDGACMVSGIQFTGKLFNSHVTLIHRKFIFRNF